MKNYYKILNINNNATNKEIKHAYKKLVLKYHPDKNNGKENNMFELINNAYHTLIDPYTRGKYDQKLEHYNNSIGCNYTSPFGMNLFGGENFMDNELNDFINLRINKSYDSKFNNMFDNAFSMISDMKNNNNKEEHHFVSSGSFYSSHIDNNGNKKVTKKMYRDINGKKDNYKNEYIERPNGSRINEKESGNKNLFKKKYNIKN
jgi:DnaJ-class molecular chaperone